MRWSLKTLMAAALALGGAVAMQAEPASAQPRWQHRGAPLAGPGVVSRYGGGYRPVYFGSRYDRGMSRYYQGYRSAYEGPRSYGGYRSAYYGPRYYGGYRSAYYGPRYYRGYPYRYYRRSNGGAVAAGLIGGLALGAITSAVANPYYYPYYAPAYYRPARTCFTERRRIVNRYGRVVVRRVQTCY
jgi:hypothetical protein